MSTTTTLLQSLPSSLKTASVTVFVVALLSACTDSGPQVNTSTDNTTNASAQQPSNGLTFASGENQQTQPRTGLDQHIDNGLQPTLASLQEEIFTPRCATCHTGNGDVLPGMMDLSNAEATYISLINSASTEFPTLPLIAPGMSTNSYLVRKIEGTQLVGSQMPLQGGPLTTQEIISIKSWIDQGAQQ